MRTLKICSLSNFQINNIALLTVASILHLTLLELIPLKTGFLSLWHRHSLAPFPSPWKPPIYCSFQSNCFRCLVLVRSQDACLSLSDLFHLLQWPQGPSVMSKMAGFPRFLWPSHIHIHVHTCISYLLYPVICWWTHGVSPCPGYCEWLCSKHRSVGNGKSIF